MHTWEARLWNPIGDTTVMTLQQPPKGFLGSSVEAGCWLLPQARCSVPKSCLTLCDLMDCSLPGSFLHGISQAGILEWVAISFSRGSSGYRGWTRISCIGSHLLYTELQALSFQPGRQYLILAWPLCLFCCAPWKPGGAPSTSDVTQHRGSSFKCWLNQVLSHSVVSDSLWPLWTLCNPMDHSPPGSSVHGILQARILEWVAIAFSVLSSKKRKMGFPGSPVVKTPHSKCRGLWVRSLIRELRSHVPCDVAKKKKKRGRDIRDLSQCAHRGKVVWNHNEKTAVCQPAREFSSETNLASTLILNF